MKMRGYYSIQNEFVPDEIISYINEYSNYFQNTIVSDNSIRGRYRGYSEDYLGGIW